jgi:UDP-N-acetylglucosamine acyltransferase
MEIHSTAIVSPKAELASGAKIGSYSIIGDHVKIGRDTTIYSHVTIDGHTDIGERNHIHPYANIGFPPQDIGYKAEDTRVKIGNGNIIREYVSINRATAKEAWETVIGDENYLMAYVHIAHDCKLGDGIVMANAATLGGHVIVGDYSNIGGFTAVHQFVRIGAYAFLGGKCAVAQDIPPFMLATGAERAKLYGPNQKGLKRQGFSRETIHGLKKAYKIIWRRNKRFSEGIKRVREEMEPFPELEILLDFLGNSKRGVVR